MAHRFLKPAILMGVSLILATSVNAQEVKIKAGDDEYKFKSETLKIKLENGKAKIKEDVSRRTEMEHLYRRTIVDERIEPMESIDATALLDERDIVVPEPRKREPLKVASVKQEPKKVAYTGRKKTTAKATARKSTPAKKRYVAARQPVKRDTVYVVTPAETRVVKEYVRDTVLVTRVDTVYRVESQSSFTGYRLPDANVKKMKMKKDDGTIEIKKKLENGDKVKQTFDDEQQYEIYRKWLEE